MDFFPADWISEMETDDAAFIREWQMNSIDASVDSFNVNCFSPPSSKTDPTSSTESAPNYKASETNIYIPEQQLKNNDFNCSTKNYTYGQKRSIRKAYSSPSASIIAFGNASAISTQNLYGKLNRTVTTETDAVSLGEMSFPAPISPNSIQKLYAALEYAEPVKRSITRSPLQAQDHVLAERKRREKLSNLFVSLSTMIPGLKKLDKASILGGTIDYLKQLEERVRTLEQEQKKRKHEGSVVSIYAKRPQISSYDDTSSSVENFDSSLDQSLPEIEVRTCEGNVLLRVYCKKRTGIVKEILCEVENLDLCIINSSAIPFGDTTLHMSVIAQMNGEFCLPNEDLAENIRRAIQKLI